MDDIKIKADNINFKYRVSGIVIINNKVLVVQIMDNGFYCLPGGHVKLGELSSQAIKREMREELPRKNNKIICIKNYSLFAINEIIFKRQDSTKVHELSLIYKIDLKNNDDVFLNDIILFEKDDIIKKMDFKWVDINDLENINFKPKNIIAKIKNNDFSLVHFIEND